MIKRTLISFLFVLLIIQSVSATPPPSETWMSNSSVVGVASGSGIVSSVATFNDSGFWEMIVADTTCTFKGYNQSSSGWALNTSIVSGLSDPGDSCGVTWFKRGNVQTLIISHGSGGMAVGYTKNNTQSSWVLNWSQVNGLNVSVIDAPKMSYFSVSNTDTIVISASNGTFSARSWNGTYWVSNATSINGLQYGSYDVGDNAFLTQFMRGNVRTAISGNLTGEFTAFTWNGTGYELNTSQSSGLGDIGELSTPHVFYKDNIYQLIAGNLSSTSLIGFSIPLVNTLRHIEPVNQTTLSSTSLNLKWAEYTVDTPHTYQISTDNQFINVVSQGSSTSKAGDVYTTDTIGLSYGTQYYWHVKNSTGSYTNWWTFNTSSIPLVDGRFNITVRDEQTNDRIDIFTTQLINSTKVLSKSTTTGWTNFSAAEVINGEYLVRIIPNSSYASRSVLSTSPTNVTVYLPSTANNTIDTVGFYLIDYTGLFPWTTSNIQISKNSSVMHSSYFDADAKVAVYLIRGDSYGITIVNEDNVQNWGNYIAVGTGAVNIALSNFGVDGNESFVFNISRNPSNISLSWSSELGYLTSLNYSIYKGTEKTLVHQLITSVRYGQSSYTVTNTSDIYYVEFSALTSDGWKNQSFASDYRSGTQLSGIEGKKVNLIWNSFTMPEWVMTLVCLLLISAVAGGFGAINAPIGAIVLSIMVLMFIRWGWLDTGGAMYGFISGIAVVSVLSYLRDRDTGAPSMMAYKAALFLIFANLGIMIVNVSGILIGGAVVQGQNVNVFYALLSSFMPSSTESVTYGAILTMGFGLMFLTLPAILAIFVCSFTISQVFITNFNLPFEWSTAFRIGIAIIYIIGYNQYRAMTSLREKE